MTRHRSWVLASIPARCDVCRGQTRVLMWPAGAPELAAVVPCPHCQRTEPLPIAMQPETA